MANILVPGRNCQGIYETSRTGILVDGRNYYRAFYDAASHAKRYILMTGWQFERRVRLLRGKDEPADGSDTRMEVFLNGLCDRNPELHIFILIWDFSALVSFDKEWFNKFILDLTSNERIHFRFDNSHALYASHHQKLVVVDGAIAFTGGLDICANGWDDRKHWAANADRVLMGEQYEPYHDVQSFSTGPVAWQLTRLFEKRWVDAGGRDLQLEPPARLSPPVAIRHLIPLSADKVAISVTRGQSLLPLLEPVMHIRQLYLDAIRSAEKLIYIENQYFSSQAVYQAIKDRLTDRTRPCPDIVLLLPKRFHTFIEDLSLSVVQAKMLRSLAQIAAAYGRPFGIYYTAAALKSESPEKPTYVHSKLLVVDDYFLTVGSANITNRSMGMDTELNLVWEADPDDAGLIRSIRRVRASLLMEHTGLRKLSQRRSLGLMSGLVEYLNRHAGRSGCRLRMHSLESFLEDMSWMKDLVPEDLSIDPERPIIEESIYEVISRDKNGFFAKGIIFLNELARTDAFKNETLTNLSQDLAARPAKERPLLSKLGNRGLFRWYLFSIIAAVIIVLLWFLFKS